MILSLTGFVETQYQENAAGPGVLPQTGTIVTLPRQSVVGQTAPAAAVAGRVTGAMPRELEER
jgi:hypothetical protein